jgi:radical SAM superfamily enzyme YgiQ (UPF0313 family)
LRVVLISTYELGHQPFGLSSPAAILKGDGHDVTCVDLAISPMEAEALRDAGLIAFYLPMHTATRLAVPLIERIRQCSPNAYLCCYGLYAPLNESLLRRMGVGAVFGGEFEQELKHLALRLVAGDRAAQSEALISLERISFAVPDRSSLPALHLYPRLRANGRRKVAGYTEASRGCKHLCRHCPVVPVYGGQFRVVPREVVLADIRQQVAAGAEHITFGDPDFFNGPGHAVRIVESLHREFPQITYDVTIKVEHLRRHADLLGVLKESGCLFVTSAVESVDDRVLERLEKGHTREDFIEVVHEFREVGLDLSPTFIPFTPWTTVEGYCDLLQLLFDLDLVENVAGIQLALRLLIPSGSRLLELEEIQATLSAFDEGALVYRWKHPDARVDELAGRLFKLVAEGQGNSTRRSTFARIWETAFGAPLPEDRDRIARAAIPYLEEPWYC